MKDNNGFTLIELLVVMMILTGMSLIVVMGITASLDRRDVKECEEQQALAINAAKIYFSLTNTTTVSVGTLKAGNYFSSDNKLTRLDNSHTIKIDGNSYKYLGTCKQL